MSSANNAQGSKRTPTTLRLPNEMRDRLAQEADERCTSVTKLVEKAVEWYLPRLPSLEANADG